MRTNKRKNAVTIRMKYSNGHIDWDAAQVRECLLLALYGQSRRVIAAQTRLTESQISYRLKQKGVKISDYRNGKSLIARKVIKTTKNFVAAHLDKELAAIDAKPNKKYITI